MMGRKIRRIVVIALFLLGIALALFYRDQIDVEQMRIWVDGAGLAAPIVFMSIYVVGTVFFIPGSVLTFAGGALFGPVLGTVYNLTAATVGATIAFVAARYMASDWVEKKTQGHLKTLKQGVEGEGWRFVAFVRLVPLFPFNILNYALGLTNIKWHHYSLATFICMLPGAIAYTYIGYVGREALAGDEAIIQKLMLGVALLAVAGFLPGVIRKLRAKSRVGVKAIKSAS